MKTYTITLPDELAAVAEKLVADGKFDSMENLLRYGLELAEDEVRADADIDIEWLRAQIAAGDASGEATDGETFFAELEAGLYDDGRLAHATDEPVIRRAVGAPNEDGR